MGWFQLPALLQYPPHLIPLCLNMRVSQQDEDVIGAERESIHTDPVHNVKDKLLHLYLQSVAVAADDALQGLGMQQRRGEPHTTFLFGG